MLRNKDTIILSEINGYFRDNVLFHTFMFLKVVICNSNPTYDNPDQVTISKPYFGRSLTLSRKTTTPLVIALIPLLDTIRIRF
ncbi:hypothetical protein FHX64_001390 [Microbacter margulisiae]|uniref:Uncharacterized protein n=1 Tax=Microbacter margulisiae TaxID=1350067 RepID=A0A7W5DQI8_9PORP|nr:hypothetical protein [Microbacter margulisiae]